MYQHSPTNLHNWNSEQRLVATFYLSCNRLPPSATVFRHKHVAVRIDPSFKSVVLSISNHIQTQIKAMNIFRLTGDCCHSISIAIFLHVICWKKNASCTFCAVFYTTKTTCVSPFQSSSIQRVIVVMTFLASLFDIFLNNYNDRCFTQVPNFVHGSIRYPLLGSIYTFLWCI